MGEMNEIIETNSVDARLGICNMNVEIKRKVLRDNDDLTNDIQYLSFSFYQQSEVFTAGVTEITINSVTKEDVLELAKEIKKLAATFK